MRPARVGAVHADRRGGVVVPHLYGDAMAARTKSAKDRPSYRCTECGWTTAKWLGRCPECQAWGTVEEFGGAPAVRTTAAGRVSTAAVPIGQVDSRTATARSTGVGELDRVLGGGLVPGAVVLLAGEPGVGKSTLLLDVAAKAASDDHRTLYVTAEESASQVRLRADRIKAINDHLYLAAETDLSAVLGHLDAVKPSLLILDSVQTVASPEIDGAPGGMAQVREVAGALIRASKERGMATLLVGHVTKDGAIAGPRLLEHLVDVVLSFEGTGTPGCGWCAASRTVTGRPTRSAASSCTTRASPVSPTPRASS